MSRLRIKEKILSFYLIFTIITLGFIGLLVFEGVVDEGSVEAATIIVDCNGKGNYITIQEAIDNASSGDTIYVWAGTYYENVRVNKTVTLIGNGTANTIINGGGLDNVVEIRANWVNITNFTIMNSSYWYDSAGINLCYAQNCSIYNNNCSNNPNGIYLYSSSNNTFTNNTCLNGNNNGFFLGYDTDKNKLMNNTCLNNNNGIYLRSYWVGQTLQCKSNTLMNNRCNSNNFSGILLYISSSNTIMNNTCNSNNRVGILLDFALDNTIMNNTCNSNNLSGIWLASNEDTLMNNTCNSNYLDGITLRSSSKNTIMSNKCSNNKNGIRLYDFSSSNTLSNNLCSDNENGIELNSSSNNQLRNNTYCLNNGIGIYLTSSTDNNYIYHNNIIFNTNQANDIGNNYWNNSQHEGNYWSDYAGKDNGAGDRVKGDGIGDTNIPHLDLDNYPFINKYGWLYPNTPILIDLEDVDSDGCYEISWKKNVRTIGYILEEDENNRFESPTVICNGSNLLFDIRDKTNGTYYYRLKAYNQYYESNWSNIINVIVDWTPDIPKNFLVSFFPEGNSLNLSWDLNQIDTKKYHIEYKNETITNWMSLVIIQHPENTFNHTNLQDGLQYNYRMRAEDYRGQLSNYSKITSGTPQDIIPPKSPINVSFICTTNEYVKLHWKPNFESDLSGYNIYKFTSKTSINHSNLIGSSISGYEEYIDKNINVTIPYYYAITAYDEVPNESEFSLSILGPFPPEINHSIENITLIEDRIDESSIKLYHCFKDINNDNLIFWADGQKYIDVIIDQTNGDVKLIPEKDWNGQETITFYASDGVWNISNTIKIIITPVNDPPDSLKILSPENNTISNNTTPINFIAICNDPDIKYGDKLTFKWLSNISGEIGIGDNITRIIVEPGYHKITVIVTDYKNLSISTSFNITVLSTNNSNPYYNDSNKPDNDDNGKINLINSITIFFISALIVVYIIILLLIILRKKAQDSDKEIDMDSKQSNFKSNLDRQIIKTDGELIINENKKND